MEILAKCKQLFFKSPAFDQCRPEKPVNQKIKAFLIDWFFIYLFSYLFIYLFFIKTYNMGTMAKNGFRKQYLLLPTQQVLEKNEIESTLRGSLWRYQWYSNNTFQVLVCSVFFNGKFSSLQPPLPYQLLTSYWTD